MALSCVSRRGPWGWKPHSIGGISRLEAALTAAMALLWRLDDACVTDGVTGNN